MGGAPTVRDSAVRDTVRCSSPKKQPKNNRHYNWGRRLVGHPRVLSHICLQSRGDLHQRERERERERERDADDDNTPKKRQKTAGAGAMPRGKCGARGTGRRRGACAGRRDTRGTTNCSAVCVSPAPEKEKERHSTTAGKNNQTTRENERDPSNESNRGRVLKGKKKQTKNLCFRAKNPSRTPKTKKKESENPKTKSQVWEAKDRRGGGAHGPPRDLQGSVLRVLDTEETQGLPRLGNRPQDSRSLQQRKGY